LARLVAWADEQILRLDEPPLWLIELSLATDEAGLRRARERAPRRWCLWRAGRWTSRGFTWAAFTWRSSGAY